MTDTEHGGMTALTPQQMRELATALDAGVFRNEGLWPDEAQDVENSIVALRAAADEMDRLRAVSERAERRAEIEKTEGIRQAKRAARLRISIENAERTHADDCTYLEDDVVEPIGSRISPNAHCTCWKADVR